MVPFDTLQNTARSGERATSAPSASSPPSATSARSAGDQHLLLASRGALYALDAAYVCEVHALPAVDFLPQAPRFVAGVVNVRGTNLPVVDLASRLEQTPQAPRLSDGLVVLQLAERRIALWVEEVRDIVSLPRQTIEAAPFANEYSIVSHMTQLHGEVVLLLHAERLPSKTDFEPRKNEEENNARAAKRHENVREIVDEETLKIFRARAARLAQGTAQTGQTAAQLIITTTAPEAEQKTAVENITTVARVILGGEERGVVLTQVREFCALENFAPVPCCPSHIVGQMNLRGEVVTLLDIAPRLGLQQDNIRQGKVQSVSQVVVVKREAMRGEEAGLVGVVVEEVRDVLQLREHEIRALGLSAAARAGEKVQGAILHGAILHDERWISILDLPTILADEEWVVDELV